MVDALVDTSVIVDLLRGYPPAQSWFLTQSNIGVCRVVWLEIIEGAPNGSALRHALKLLKRLPLEEIIPADMIWATERLISINLSHNVDAFDCMIAAVNYRLQVPLYTQNIKHFAPLIGTLALRPY